jgi:ubiquinone biosynthesis protein COQ9
MKKREKMGKRDKIKREIIERALTHVPFESWSQDLLERSAAEIGVDSSYGWRLFPKGPLEAISDWSAFLDQEMLTLLPNIEGQKVRERIRLAIKTRLTLLIPHREAARKTATYLARPPHMSLASRLIYQTVNEMWYYAGDTATDYNFYTKRGLLSWVYMTTFFYFLRDQSPDFEKTWTFLDHRLEEVLALPKVPQKIAHWLFSWRHHG